MPFSYRLHHLLRVALCVQIAVLGWLPAQACLDHGADFVLIGRGAMLHHDFARRALADAGFKSVERPVTRAYLQGEGLGPRFLEYVATTWPRFVAD